MWGDISKLEVARMIQNFIPACRVTHTEEGEDKDKRDYEVSYRKIRRLGYRAEVTFKDGLQELVKILPYLNDNDKINSRNA